MSSLLLGLLLAPVTPQSHVTQPFSSHQNLLFFNFSLPPIWSLQIPVSLSTKEKIPNPHYLNQQLSFASNKTPKPNGIDCIREPRSSRAGLVSNRAECRGPSSEQDGPPPLPRLSWFLLGSSGGQRCQFLLLLVCSRTAGERVSFPITL